MHDHYFEQDQRRRLARRQEELGEEALEQTHDDWFDLFESLNAEMRAGTDPADARLDELRARAAGLIDAFTSGDSELLTSLDRIWSSEGSESVSESDQSRAPGVLRPPAPRRGLSNERAPRIGTSGGRRA